MDHWFCAAHLQSEEHAAIWVLYMHFGPEVTQNEAFIPQCLVDKMPKELVIVVHNFDDWERLVLNPEIDPAPNH